MDDQHHEEPVTPGYQEPAAPAEGEAPAGVMPPNMLRAIQGLFGGERPFLPQARKPPTAAMVLLHRMGVHVASLVGIVATVETRVTSIETHTEQLRHEAADTAQRLIAVLDSLVLDVASMRAELAELRQLAPAAPERKRAPARRASDV